MTAFSAAEPSGSEIAESQRADQGREYQWSAKRATGSIHLGNWKTQHDCRVENVWKRCPEIRKLRFEEVFIVN